MSIWELLSALERCRAAWCQLIRLHSQKDLELGFAAEMVGLHMTNASQQECGKKKHFLEGVCAHLYRLLMSLQHTPGITFL